MVLKYISQQESFVGKYFIKMKLQGTKVDNFIDFFLFQLNCKRSFKVMNYNVNTLLKI